MMRSFRHAGVAVAGAVSALIAAAFFTDVGALQRPSYSYQLVVDQPLTLQAALRAGMRGGYGCAAVARPVAPLLSRNVAVILGPGAGVAPQEVAVVYAHADATDDFAKDVNAAAGKGVPLCGVAIVASI